MLTKSINNPQFSFPKQKRVNELGISCLMAPNSAPPQIHAVSASYGADFHEIIEYGNLKYHLLLQFNRSEPACSENLHLKRLYAAMDTDENAVETEAANCRDLFWDFIESDYENQRASTEPQHHPELIKLQALTKDAILSVVYHRVEYPNTKPIDNIFSHVPTFHSSHIKRLNEIDRNIFKIELQNSIYCLKSVSRADDQSFVREVSILQKCSHPNIIRLIGLLVDERDRVEGMITDYVDEARPLREVHSLSSYEFEKWSNQIREAIAYLHGNGMVWGDAKAANVLIRQNGDIVLIDFGGGHTKGWVDLSNMGTEDGDMQGMQSIINFMRERVR